MAKGIISQLREKGKVTRGYLGIHFQPLTADLAKSFGLDSEKGALIANVEKDTPAEKAGLKAGDVILAYDGKLISEGNELSRFVAVTPINKKVDLVIFRDGKKQEVTVVVGRLKDSDGKATDLGGNESDKIGIVVQELSKELAVRLGVKDTRGLIIAEVKPASSAEEAGISAGDMIIEINSQHPDSMESYSAAVSKLKNGDVVRLLLKRSNGNVYYVALRINQ
jgi:serine protease Do